MSGQPASADEPMLNGPYAFEFGPPTADGTRTYWYDFSTDCSGPGGCVAHGNQTNTNDRGGPQPGFESVVSFQFLDGRWFRSGQYDLECADGSVVRFTWSWTLNPQPDGSLTGSRESNPSGSCPDRPTSGVTESITARPWG